MACLRVSRYADLVPLVNFVCRALSHGLCGAAFVKCMQSRGAQQSDRQHVSASRDAAPGQEVEVFDSLQDEENHQQS